MQENDRPDIPPPPPPPIQSSSSVEGGPAPPAGSPRRRTRFIPWALASIGLVAALTLLSVQLGTSSDLRRTEKDLAEAQAEVESLSSRIDELTSQHEEASAELEEVSRDLEHASSKGRELAQDLRACRSFLEASFRAHFRLGPDATDEEIARAVGPQGYRHLLTCLDGEVPWGGGGGGDTVEI